MDNKVKQLTPREMEILELVSKGLKSKEIAKMLFISAQTVKNHRSNIINRLKAVNMEQAVAMLCRGEIQVKDRRGGYKCRRS